MIELQVTCYVVGLLLVWAGAPWEAALGAWAVGFVMVLRGGADGRRNEPSAGMDGGRMAD